MESTFLTFQKFNDLELAEAIHNKLQENNIVSFIENERKFFDATFANNNFGADIRLKLKPTDFTKAHQILQDFYIEELNSVDKNYYLFDFSDEELIEIISKPDEWGYFDYQLSQKILKERGKEIKPNVAELLKTQRLKELAKPDTPHRYWIYLGYFSAVFGGLFGLIIGWTLAYFKKTLPDGQRVYVYRENERNHGTRMLLISCISLILGLLIRLFFND